MYTCIECAHVTFVAYVLYVLQTRAMIAGSTDERKIKIDEIHSDSRV